MDKKEKFQNDPAKFFLYQDRLLTQSERNKAKVFSQNVFNLEHCSLCQKEYNLSLKAPRILVNCGHTLCTECLYMFFKDQKVKCPLCTKFVKRLRAVEVLPLNHAIFHKLSAKGGLIDKIKKELKYNNELAEEIQKNDTIDYPVCEFHKERLLHFVHTEKKHLYCRACLVKNIDKIQGNIVDLYLLRPEHVRLMMPEMRTAGTDPIVYDSIFKEIEEIY